MTVSAKQVMAVFIKYSLPNVQSSGTSVLRSPALRDGGWTGPTSVTVQLNPESACSRKLSEFVTCRLHAIEAAESPDVVCRDCPQPFVRRFHFAATIETLAAKW